MSSKTLRVKLLIATALALSAVVAAVATADATTPASALAAGTRVQPTAYEYVALGDSWPSGAHCGGCRTFVTLYADGLRKKTGRKVRFTNLTGAAAAARLQSLCSPTSAMTPRLDGRSRQRRSSSSRPEPTTWRSPSMPMARALAEAAITPIASERSLPSGERTSMRSSFRFGSSARGNGLRSG